MSASGEVTIFSDSPVARLCERAKSRRSGHRKDVAFVGNGSLGDELNRIDLNGMAKSVE
jgi:hypothetical protein